MANKNAAMVSNEWFNALFIPDVESCLRKRRLHFKALLLIDNAQQENVNIVFYHITSLLQPSDQGIVFTCKAVYNKQTLWYILKQKENDGALTLMVA